MDWVLHGSIKADLPATVPLPLAFPPSPSSPPPPPLQGPPPPPPHSVGSFANKISPNILLIIVILAIIFFISGFLHLLIRYLRRTRNREPDETANATVLQGQLQQLFNLHDSGVDQSFIDTLPLFLYKAIIGLKDPFDCAVCLCEFEPDDKLRLLPKCSHAFHIECIDTWLLSHSTCPLCRSSLLPDFSPSNSCSPLVLVLESGSESSREIASERGDFAPNANSYLGDDETSQKSVEVAAKEEANVSVSEAVVEGKVVPVKLGKFRSVEANGGGGGEGTSNGTSNLDQRRCFSMGSYEYVMNETASLQVAIKPPKKKTSTSRRGYRQTMSECDFHSKREGFKGFDASRGTEFGEDHGGGVGSGIQKESFSISKTWLRRVTQEDPALGGSSRRAFSFRLPLSRPLANETGDLKSDKCGSEFDMDVEVGSCSNSMISRTDETPSFARRTLLWLVGRQSRVGSHL